MSPSEWMPLPATWGKRLHQRFSTLYGPTFTNQFPGDQSINDWVALWCNALAGVTAEQIRKALERCALDENPFPPKPGIFLKLMQPTNKDLNLPTDDQAFRSWLRTSSIPLDIRSWKDVHPGVHWCHQCLTADMFNLSKRPENEQKKAFLEFWSEAKNMAAKGEPFTNRIDAPQQAPQTPVAAQKPETDSDIAERTPAHQAQVEAAGKYLKIIRENLAKPRKVNN